MAGLRVISIDIATIVALLLFSFAPLMGGSLADMLHLRGTRVKHYQSPSSELFLFALKNSTDSLSVRNTLSNHPQKKWCRVSSMATQAGDLPLALSFAFQITDITKSRKFFT